ncbi:MAG: aryl-sulfate sulfotransferase [candidate division WOR-3 bacterium]
MGNRRTKASFLTAARHLLLPLSVLSLVLPAPAQVWDGIVLYNPVYSRTASLIDTNGQVINSWQCTTTPAYAPYLLPDSTIWRPDVYPGASMRGGVYGGWIRRYNWQGDIIDAFVWSDSFHQQHHDIHPMPNGNILLLAWDRKTRAQAQAMGRVNINGDMWSEEIVEYDPVADSVVWYWRAWDHLIQDVDPNKPNYGVVREHPELIDINLGTLFMYGDWLHANMLDYNEERDEIIFCSHFLNELYIIDHSTTTEQARGHTGGRHGKGGDIIYRWGNPMNYDRGDSSDQHFFVVHGANWIRSGLRGAGNILVFNNGDRPGTANDYSSVEEITPPLDSNDHYYIHPDSAFGPAAPSWVYARPGQFYSGHMGGAYRLPNGNTFITEAVSGRLFEIDSAGNTVWQRMVSTWTGRAIKYPRNFATGIAHNPPEPAARPEITCALPLRAGRAQPVSIHLNQPDQIRLRLCDPLGRTLATLIDARLSAGTHHITFKPADETARNGICFLHLATGCGSCQTLKLPVLH